MKLTPLATVTLTAALMLPSGTALAQDASPSPSEATQPSPAAGSLAEAFPVEVGGVLLADSIEIVTGAEAMADGDASLEALASVADTLGVTLDDVAIGSAFTFTDLSAENGVFIIAIQVPGMDPATGLELMLGLFTIEADEDLVIGEAEVAGKQLTTLSSAANPESVAYLYAGGDMAWMVAAPVPAELEEAISQLP